MPQMGPIGGLAEGRGPNPMTPAEQIARLRETAQLRALQRPHSTIRSQMQRQRIIAQAHREELAKRQPQIDWLTRKLARQQETT